MVDPCRPTMGPKVPTGSTSGTVALTPRSREEAGLDRSFEIATLAGVPYGQVNALFRVPELLLEHPEATSDRYLVVELAGLEVRKAIRIVLGSPEETGLPDPATRLPIGWRGEDPSGAFPTLEGELVAEPLSGNETLLTLRGRYRPPLGPLGYGIDRLVLHRVARAAIQDFFSQAVDRLEEAYAQRLELEGEPLM